MKISISLFSFCLLSLLPVSFAMALGASDLNSIEVTVAYVADGDTLELETPIPGFSNGGKVRILGIQAFEENDDSSGVPECNATKATAKLAELIGCVDHENNYTDAACPANTKVTLKVWDTTLSSAGRPMRYVFKGDVNIGEKLVEEGYVLAFANPNETLYNKDLFKAQQNAVADEKGPLWNSAKSECSDGPGAGSQLDMWVNYNAPGDDSLAENRNGEWLKIQNNGSSSVNLSHWKLRDTGLGHMWDLPNGAIIAAGQTITVKVGSGTNSNNVYYMNQNSAVFENTIPEGAYLLDYWGSTSRHGEIQAQFTYPCYARCSDPLQGKIEMTVNYDAEGYDIDHYFPNGEWVTLKNISFSSINLEKYMLNSGATNTNFLNFNSSTTINAGETLTVYIGEGSDSRLTKYWGKGYSILDNDEDRVWLSTYDSRVIAEKKWPESVEQAVEGMTLAPIVHLLLRY